MKKFYKEGSLKYRIITYLMNIIGYSNKNIAGLQIKNKVFRYIKRKYKFEVPRSIVKNDFQGVRKTIWTCWFQGMENAPELVNICIQSIKKNCSDYEIVVITYKNMAKYVTFPDYIIQKWKKGIIKDALMSDLLRMELLIKYGGIWMDATVFMTGKIPEIIQGSEFFIYSHLDSNDITMNYNNWFIKSNKNNEFLIRIRDFLYEYWKKEKRVKEYFIWHLAATNIANLYPNLLENMPVISDVIPEQLCMVLNNKYNEKYWNYLCDLTTIHKLSYKVKCKNDCYTYLYKVREYQ